MCPVQGHNSSGWSRNWTTNFMISKTICSNTWATVQGQVWFGPVSKKGSSTQLQLLGSLCYSCWVDDFLYLLSANPYVLFMSFLPTASTNKLVTLFITCDLPHAVEGDITSMTFTVKLSHPFRYHFLSLFLNFFFASSFWLRLLFQVFSTQSLQLCFSLSFALTARRVSALLGEIIYRMQRSCRWLKCN